MRLGIGYYNDFALAYNNAVEERKTIKYIYINIRKHIHDYEFNTVQYLLHLFGRRSRQ